MNVFLRGPRKTWSSGIRHRARIIIIPHFFSDTPESENARDADYYTFRYKIWTDPVRAGGHDPDFYKNQWEVLLERIRKWANEVIAWPDTPDYWELLRNSWQNLATSERNWNNTPFSPEEQAAISAQLTAIKESLRKARKLRKDQISLLEEKLDKLLRASHREGRIDWGNLFVQSIVALMVTDTITPEVSITSLWWSPTASATFLEATVLVCLRFLRATDKEAPDRDRKTAALVASSPPDVLSVPSTVPAVPTSVCPTRHATSLST